MKVCHVVPSINEDIGGPAQSVSQLSIQLASIGISSELFTLDYKAHGKQVGKEELSIHSFPAHMISRSFRGLHFGAMQELVRITSSGFDLIHNHGLWMFPNFFARRAAELNGLPLVISPRGMLEQWSLNRSIVKKKLAWHLFEKRSLQFASMFHATSESELESIRRVGLTQPVAVIPNGVQPYNGKLLGREAWEKAFPQCRGEKCLLFMSRLDPKKGVDRLIQIYSKLATDYPQWHLLIAGPDLIGYQAHLEQMVDRLSIKDRVTFAGALRNELKQTTLSEADLFILPTHSENFGIVVAEALAAGTPVITTKEAPWHILQTAKCGWWVEDCSDSIEGALREALELSSEQRQEMGKRAKEMVSQLYSWEAIAEQFSNAYAWLLNKGDKPDFISL